MFGNETSTPSNVSEPMKLIIQTNVDVDSSISTIPITFSEALTTYFNITYEDSWSYTLPEVEENPSVEDIAISVTTQGPITYNEDSKSFKLSNSLSESDIGIYKVEIELSDTNSTSIVEEASFSFELQVSNVEAEADTDSDSDNEDSSSTESSEDESTSSDVEITISTETSTFDVSKLSRLDQAKISRPLTAHISKIDRKGIIKIGFSNSMIVPDNYKDIFQGRRQLTGKEELI